MCVVVYCAQLIVTSSVMQRHHWELLQSMSRLPPTQALPPAVPTRPFPSPLVSSQATHLCPAVFMLTSSLHFQDSAVSVVNAVVARHVNWCQAAYLTIPVSCSDRLDMIIAMVTALMTAGCYHFHCNSCLIMVVACRLRPESCNVDCKN